MSFLVTAALVAGGVWLGMNHPVVALAGLLVFVFGSLVLAAIAEATK